MRLLSIRLPDRLIEALDILLRNGRNRSDIIRSAVEEYIEKQEHSHAALSVNPEQSMMDILKKRDNNLLLSHGEIEFIAMYVHNAYMFSRLPIVSSHSINEVLRMFMKIRNASESGDMTHQDKYYMGNFGVHKNTINEAVQASIISDHNYTCAGFSQFKSRNLEVITRDINDINLEKINKIIDPHIDAVIAIACRSFWQGENAHAEFLEKRVTSIGEYGENKEFHLKNIIFSCRAQKNAELAGALLLDSQNVWICPNNFFEIEEIFLLAGAFIDNNPKLTEFNHGKMFSIQPYSKKSSTLSGKNFRIILENETIKNIALLYNDILQWSCYQQAQQKYGII